MCVCVQGVIPATPTTEISDGVLYSERPGHAIRNERKRESKQVNTMKRAVFTTTTTLPADVPRGTVLGTLQDHQEMIKLNPMVTNYKPCYPAASAPTEEMESEWTWYEITDRISFLPGGLVRGNVSYKGCFRDIPRGIRTHVYAPTGLDIQATWSVGGSQPDDAQDGKQGEGEQAREGEKLSELKDTTAPPPTTSLDEGTGLYLREEVDLRCPFWSVGFVKKNLKRSHGVLVDRLVRKATGQDDQPPNKDGQSHPPPPEIYINDVQVPSWRLSEQIREAPTRRRKPSLSRAAT